MKFGCSVTKEIMLAGLKELKLREEAMKKIAIVGWTDTKQAEHICLDCISSASIQIGQDDLNFKMRHGDMLTPIFETDEFDSVPSCGICLKAIEGANIIQKLETYEATYWEERVYRVKKRVQAHNYEEAQSKFEAETGLKFHSEELAEVTDGGNLLDEYGINKIDDSGRKL